MGHIGKDDSVRFLKGSTVMDHNGWDEVAFPRNAGVFTGLSFLGTISTSSNTSASSSASILAGSLKVPFL